MGLGINEGITLVSGINFRDNVTLGYLAFLKPNTKSKLVLKLQVLENLGKNDKVLSWQRKGQKFLTRPR